MKLPTLYSRRSDGALQEWTIFVEGDKYWTISGMVQGKKVISAPTVAVVKNGGRANETTPEAQAMLEAQAAWKKKVEKKYSEDMDAVDSGNPFQPMLAKKFEDYQSDIFNEDGSIKQPVYVNYKYDGIRCVATKEGLFSRNGKKFVSIPHIEKALEPLFAEYPDAVLDGELYNGELKDDFNQICSHVKKLKPTEEDIEATRVIQYYVYDLASDVNKYSTRMNLLNVMWTRLNYSNNPVNNGLTEKPIQRADYQSCSSREGLDTFYSHAIDEGYEGVMIRLDGKYEMKRSKNLLKMKSFMDEEFIIDGVFEGIGNRSNIAANVTLCDLNGNKLITENGEQAKANIIGSHAYCRELLLNKETVIGKVGTVKFFRYGNTGAPYLPHLKAIRDFE